ncbi:MAG: endopeptidase La [Lachnospiraceae bacterium]|nr:endopeptidase La [Lachnospiraceae bacterium]
MEDKLITLPAIALRGLAVLPDMIQHFDISREMSVSAVENAMVDEQKVFLVTQRDPELEEVKIEDLYQIGTIAKIKQLVKMPGGLIRVMVEGLERAELLGLQDDGPYLKAEVILSPLKEERLNDTVKEAMSRVVKDKLEEFGNANPKMVKDFMGGLLVISDLEELLVQTAGQFPLDYKVKQELLECEYVSHLYERVVYYLMREIEIIRIKRDYQVKVKANIDKNQRDYVLREELRVIQEELGEEYTGSDADTYLAQLEKLNADKEVKEKIKKEIMRFKVMPGGSQEANVLRTYIETVMELPWKKMTKDNQNIKHAKDVLEEDHYGLEKVKERVLEYLAVRVLTKKGQTPIICLVGPPGTGKTSIARSVARALNKKYVRISLGGVHDEAEIRGHRKTYVGSMPGRIAEAMRQAGVANPLMLLDEIDKVSSDYKGDVSSALLEVLDGEQNVKFRDHYVEIPLDLSNVLFIATANTTQTIPRPLLDRMEVIEVSSYTENEKFHIAKKYLLPKQLERNGLTEGKLVVSDKALEKIIHNYTREAGVRNLERRIGELCRKAAWEFLEKEKTAIRVTEGNLEKYLGKEKITFESANEEDEVGIVRGLAWTSVGGDTLQIEVNVMPGTGKLVMTGQMGDVMKESAQIALTYVRSISEQYEIERDYFEKHDLHLHIPEGAVPKDGPSAGITMATAMLSAVTGKKVRADVAMTGEVTLRGRVLPIGGLKEKTLAARMAHIKKVLVPEKNRPDMAEVSKEITKGMEIVFVKTMEDVVREAFAAE